MLFDRQAALPVYRRLAGIIAVVLGLFAFAPSATAAVTVNPSSLPAGTQGVDYDQTVTGAGGVAPYTFAVTTGTLPAGLTLDGTTGNISGTASTQGVYTFTIQATDSTSATGARSYTVSVGTFSLAVQPNTLPNSTVGAGYSQTLSAVGGNPPYTFTVSSGTLPTGISLSSGGQLTGTTTTAGSYTFIIRADDPDGNNGYRTYTIKVGDNVLTINPATLPNGTQGTAYSQTVIASGGAGSPYSYSISAGSLPAGLSLNAGNGQITGTPSAGGAFNFTVRAVDGDTNYGTRNYSVTIGANSLALNPASLPNTTTGSAYNQSVTASGGTGGPYTYSVSSGSLPTGLSLDVNSGAITGTASAGGTFNFTISVVDGNNNFGSRAYTINVGTNSLSLTPASLPNGQQGSAYSQSVTASGGAGPYTYAVNSGALPTGLSLNASSGAITGTPTAAGNYTFTIGATDQGANFGSHNYGVTIAPPPLTVNPATLPNGTQGAAYNQTISTANGTGPYAYAVTAGALPTGLTLNAGSGQVSGTPTAAGSYNFTIQSTDSTSNTGTRAYAVTIGSNSLALNPATLPNGSTGVAYNQTVTASGGTAPYSYAVTAGSLPAGLSLNASSGVISGTPTTSGAASFTIQATDSTSNIGSRAYAFNIGGSALTVNPATLPNAGNGIAYSQTVSATGGTGPYNYAITSGALPAGLSFDGSTGAIGGTPTGSGVSNFTIRATDSNGNVGSRAYSVNVGTGTLTISPTTLSSGSQGVAYTQTLTASGGTGPYAFAILSGTLPAGLSLNGSTGAITGTPTGTGISNFGIRGTDANGNTGTRAYALNIGANTLVLNPSSLPSAALGRPYSQTLTASGGTSPYVFSIASGSLPPGLTLNASTGAMTGTPTTAGVFSFSLSVSDSNGNSGSRAFVLSTSRNDPSQDPDVRGLIDAQAASARRFTETQTTNVMRRLEGLHGGFNPCGMAFGITASTPAAQPPPVIGSYGYENGATPLSKDPISKDPWGAPSRHVDRAPPPPACDPGSNYALWSTGTVELGKATNTGSVSNKFSTSGVSAGIDTRVFDKLIVGAAAGFGTDRTDIGLKGSLTDSSSRSAMVYASFTPAPAIFIDAILGKNWLDFDTTRRDDIAGTFSGKRTGNGWFGSIGISRDFGGASWRVSPYARLDTMTATLDDYSERGDASAALTYRASKVSSNSAVVGLRGSIDLHDDGNIFTPTIRAEYRRAFDGPLSQQLYYSDVGASYLYRLDQGETTRSMLTGAIGIRARIGLSGTIELEYSRSAAPEKFASWQSQIIRATARWGF